MNIIITGAPGSGKGTISNLIINDFKLAHISTGDMLRNAISNSTPVGLEAKTYMEKGELVPDEVVNMIVEEYLSNNTFKYGFILDGYPRTLEQAKKLDETLNKLSIKIDAIVNLEVSDETVMERITLRRSCPTCKAIYHLKYQKPQVLDTCDKCSSKLVQRSDDTSQSIKVRLEMYHNTTAKVVEYYKDKLNILNFDCQRKVNEIYSDVKDKLNNI